MLRLTNIHTHYGKIEALKGVSLEIDAGEIVTLVGANGAGKSTLLMSICGDPSPSQGEILYKNRPIHRLPTTQIMGREIGIVPEGRRIFPGLTVAENLMMGGFHRTPEENRDGMAHIYQLFPRLQERQQQRGGTLSGGEQQMLAIGRALMAQPKLLLMDEPSLGLAPIMISQIFDIIRTIRDEGTTIFLVEQNAHRALKIADRGYVLENGVVVNSGTGHELLHDESVRAAYLGG
ncbi:ABC transporter ATP-binding protein [Ectothiorhodospiraceae bacterium BW-2]|nr:ABC transporter ATP-binding protein [Ectothiorhodospiraceae bacterium BW-2]